MSTRRKIVVTILVGLALLVVTSVAALAMYPRQLTTWYTRVQLEAAGLEEQTFEHDRGHITYFKGGEGPPLVFIHGLADQAGSWHTIAAEFDDHTVIVVDLPGHGESPYRNDHVVSTAALEPLFELFDQLLDQPATIVGNSLGGWVSLEYALDSPGQVDRLVPVGSAGLDHDIDPTLLMPETREDARRTVHMIFGDDAPYVPAFVLDRIVERSEESLVADTFARLDQVEYLDDQLTELEVPTELVWGTEDLIFPLDYAERMDELLPHSRLHIIDGCGHSPQVGCPDEFTELLRNLVDA